MYDMDGDIYINYGKYMVNFLKSMRRKCNLCTTLILDVYVRQSFMYCRYTYIMVNMVNFLKSMYNIPLMYVRHGWGCIHTL